MPLSKRAGAITRRFLRSLLILFLFLNLVLAFHAWKFTHFYNDPELRKPGQKSFLSTASFILMGNKIPKRLNDSLPAAPHEIFKIHSADNLELEGWWLHNPINKTPAGEDSAYAHKGAIIMFHGHGSCKSAILPEANQFLKMGYWVYMIDFEAHGNSQGEQSLIGMKESADVKAAYDYVTQRGEKNIILYGVSMGAATITKAIHDYGIKPSKLVLEMPFATLLDATKGKLRIMGLPPFLAPALTFWGGTLNGAWAFNYKPYEYAGDIKCPVLLQWGRHDPRVTEEETNRIYSHLKPSKKLVIYESAAHESLFKKEPEKWRENVGVFLQ